MQPAQHRDSPRAAAIDGGGGSGSDTRAASPAAHGSRTLTVAARQNTAQGTLRLRASSSSEQRSDPAPAPRVRWASGTVDNEGLGRKKSKVCCIFRKQRAFGESDSDESDSSCASHGDHDGDDDDDDDSPNAYEYVPAARRRCKKHAAATEEKRESHPLR